MKRGLLLVAIVIAAAAGVAYWRAVQLKKPDYSKNVVLIVVDALRADHLSCYGYHRKTPNIDSFAATGSLFEWAFAPVPSTQPSFSTLLTSLHAYSHGVERHGVALSNQAVTLPEILKGKGWDTAAVVGASNLDTIFGFSQGFDFYEDHLGSKENVDAKTLDSRKRWERPAGEVNDVVFRWLDTRATKRPFFLMIHYFDTHHPYEAPAPFNSMFAHDGSESGQWKSAYDGEVQYVDQQFGRLMEKLRSKNLAKNTLVILTADHGENLGEHNWRGHDQRIHDEAVHIPMILSGPKIPAGKRFAQLLMNIDVAPAILEYYRLPIPSLFQGASLMRIFEGGPGRDFVFLQIAKRPDNFAKLTPEWQKYPEKVWAVRTANEKLIWSSDGKHEFYDLKNDPQELNNLYSQKRHRALQLESMGRRFLGKYKKYKLNSGPQKKATDNDPDEALRALGYIN